MLNQKLLGAAASIPAGQVEFTTPGTYSWTCPAGVTSVSVVCIGAGGSGYLNQTQNGGDSTFNGKTCGAGGGKGATRTAAGVGGAVMNGTGGSGGSGGIRGDVNGGGGGGAGGYAGAGGAGAAGKANNNGAPGTGGAGGGGATPHNSDAGYFWGTGGGGVGILGQGASGAGGVYNAAGSTAGSGGSGGTKGSAVIKGGKYGGGSAGFSVYPGGGGGALAYANNITVVPGDSYTVVVGLGGTGSSSDSSGNYRGGAGAVRIIWPGTTRQFPSTRTANE